MVQIDFYSSKSDLRQYGKQLLAISEITEPVGRNKTQYVLPPGSKPRNPKPVVKERTRSKPRVLSIEELLKPIV